MLEIKEMTKKRKKKARRLVLLYMLIYKMCIFRYTFHIICSGINEQLRLILHENRRKVTFQRSILRILYSQDSLPNIPENSFENCFEMLQNLYATTF